MLRMKNITKQGTRTLYNATMDCLKIKIVTEVIKDLAGTDIMPIIIIISLVIHISSLIATVVSFAKYKMCGLIIVPNMKS